MELRHLRYFIAVAEEGSLTNAAERRLHTAQPSLSRQIRDLEISVGAKLLERGARPTDKDGRDRQVRQAATSEWIRPLLDEVSG